jgi:glycosyltransferase involved in cell wall biosynthesis
MKILHVFRTPVGGLFRHVCDLARGQKALGHDVGILCDSSTGGAIADAHLREIAPYCSLGIARIKISRLPGFGDVAAVFATKAHAKKLGVDVIHAHGAKGGLYGRIAGRLLHVPSVYTPHGGSLHYNWTAFPGGAFLSSEWLLSKIGSAMVFVCEFERNSFAQKIGLGTAPNIVVHNGLWPEEFQKIIPRSDAADVFFIGDLRVLKGVDVLIEALSIVKRKRSVTANLVGDGPDMEQFQRLVQELGLGNEVRFLGRLPTAEALTCGRLLVLPSRAESFPYVVLEAGAGQVPIIASDVGGIPEILPAHSLCPPDNPQALARHIELAITVPADVARESGALANRLKAGFGADQMAEKIVAFYVKIRELSQQTEPLN